MTPLKIVANITNQSSAALICKTRRHLPEITSSFLESIVDAAATLVLR